MNKKVIISLVIIGVMILIGGLVFINSKKTSLGPQASTTETESEQQINTEPSQSQQKTLRDLFTLGIPQQCSVSLVQDGVSTNATVYVTKDKLKGDIESNVEGAITTSHIIVLNNSETYIWQDNSKEGFKMTIDNSTDKSADKTPLNFDQPGEYSCSVWVPSDDRFSLPKDVKFSDMSSLIPNPGSSDNCFVCNSLTGEEKNQCLSALKCTN